MLETAQSIIILFKYKMSLEPPATCMSVLHASSVPILSTCEAPRVLGTLTITYDNHIHTQTGAQRTDNEPQEDKIGTYGTLALTRQHECTHYQRPKAAGRLEMELGCR